MGYREVRQFARAMRRNQTPAEQFFWEKVRRRQVMGKKFNRQFIIQHEEVLGKKSFFIADFYCHEKKLIIELDGSIHEEEEQKQYDLQRSDILEEMGFRIVRFENEQVLKRWPEVEEILKTYLK